MHQQTLLNRILWLAVAGVALRALVPLGYMPAPLAEGLPFVLCPGGAPHLALAGSGHHGADTAHAAANEGTGAASPAWEFCPFGVFFSHAAPVAEYGALFPPPAQAPTFAEPDAIVRPAIARSWRARAPPV